MKNVRVLLVAGFQKTDSADCSLPQRARGLAGDPPPFASVPLFNTLLVCGAVGTAATPAFHSRPLPGTGSGRCTDRPGHYGRLLPALRGRAAGRRGHRSGPLPVRSLHAITPLPVHNPSAASRRASKAALYRAQPDGPAVYCQWSRFSQNLRRFVSPNHR